MQRKLTGIERATYVLLFAILLIYALIEAKHFFYPIALAALFSYLLYPLAAFLEEKVRIPRAISILLAIFFAFVVLYFAGNFMAIQVRKMVSDFPTLKQTAVSNLKNFQSIIETKFDISVEEQEQWLQQQVTKIFERGGEILKVVSVKALGTIEAILLIPIFAFFMLFYRDRWRNFILMLAEKQHGKLTDKLLKQISHVTTRYVVGVLTDVAILATSHSVFLTIIGLKYSVAIGIMTAMLSFIPYFGTLVSGIIPFTFSLLISSNPYVPLLIVLYFWAITFVDHNILIPTIIGGNVHLNPLITILSIIAAGTIWGIPGMIIIIPTIGVVKIVCDNVEGLEPYGYVLGIETNQKALMKLKDIWEKIKEKEDEEDEAQG